MHGDLAAKSKIGSPHGEPRLHGELLVNEILTRLPAAATVRFRAVCRAWNAALTSDLFIAAHGARTAARQPELLFFPPTGGPATSFYACSLPADGGTPAAARELLTVGNLTAEYVVLSRKPCRGLTLVFEARLSEYYVCNLSTGEHVALPPCVAARVSALSDLFDGARFLPRYAPWTPVEFSSAGLGFAPATGEHKVFRLFLGQGRKQLKCEVYTMGSGGWRPCAGDVPPSLTKFLDGLPPVAVGGSFYWLLKASSVNGVGFKNPHDPPILSLSVGAEQFGWVHMPPELPGRVRHLAELDGSLCAVVFGLHHRWGARGEAHVIELLTWSGTAEAASSSWSTRCRIDLDTLPRTMSNDLGRERHIIVPLCTAGGGKILLATGRHRVYAYDAERNSVEKVFSMEDYVDFPLCHRESRLLINIGLHEECIVLGVGMPAAEEGGKRLQVKLGGGDTVGKRKAPEKYDSVSYGGDGSMEEWWKQTSWTATLRNHLPAIQHIE